MDSGKVNNADWMLHIYCTHGKAGVSCMRELVLELMGEYGNLAVFLLILVENLFPPIPSEVILTFGGVMTACTDMTPGGVILFSTAGSHGGGCHSLRSVGRFLPDEVFRKLLCGQAGQLLHFRPEDVDLAKGLVPGSRESRRCSCAGWSRSSGA